jgi:hypothetical protein
MAQMTVTTDAHILIARRTIGRRAIASPGLGRRMAMPRGPAVMRLNPFSGIEDLPSRETGEDAERERREHGK